MGKRGIWGAGERQVTDEGRRSRLAAGINAAASPPRPLPPDPFAGPDLILNLNPASGDWLPPELGLLDGEHAGGLEPQEERRGQDQPVPSLS